MSDPAITDHIDTQIPDARRDLHGEILYTLKSRVQWEQKQVDFYKMRHNGIPRNQKPWKNAADLHWPLIDTNIEKLKPLFYQQIVSMDTVAAFVPMQTATAGANTVAEQWFDYKVRERSNLQSEALAWIDHALMSGRGVIKLTWDASKTRVQYDAIDPMYFIVPLHTKELQDADWCVHVMPMSVEAYKRAGIYDTSKETIERIKGVGEDKNDPGQTNKAVATKFREGITHNSRGDKIIVWEVYKRGEDGAWQIHTYSPVAPEIDLREPMGLPYQHELVPFIDFAYEMKDKGWYSPRGIAEILAAFEASLCHMWNQKHDAMQLFNKPMFQADREVPNTMNLRAAPGLILPYGVRPVPMQSTPVNIDQEMTSIRSIAEARVANPDYAMGQSLNTSDRRTATEIQAVGAQSQQAGDLRARMFRLALGAMYKMHWALLVQFDREDLQFRYMDAAMQLDPQMLDGRYHIEPKGGVNEINKQFLLQKAIGRKTIFQNSPWIDQAELDKSILLLDDPSLVKAVFRDPNQKGKDQTADEAKTIPALMLGQAIPVNQGDDYPARIGVLMQFLQQATTMGMPLPPFAKQAFVARLQALVQADVQADRNGGMKLGNAVHQFLQANGFIPAQPQQGTLPAPGGQPQ